MHSLRSLSVAAAATLRASHAQSSASAIQLHAAAAAAARVAPISSGSALVRGIVSAAYSARAHGAQCNSFSCRCCAPTSSSGSIVTRKSASGLPSPFAFRSLHSLSPLAPTAATAAPRCTSSSHSAPLPRPFSTLEHVGEMTKVDSADPQARFVVVYTCMVCETRAAKSVSRQAYSHGVVLLRCDGCQKLHLFADRLGWFDDNSVDVESLLAAKGVTVSRSSLDLAPEQLAQLQELQRNMQAQADARRAKQALESTDPSQTPIDANPLLPNGTEQTTPSGER